MSARLGRGLLLAVMLGAGWWASASAGVAAWEQAGAMVAACLALRCWWGQTSRQPSIGEAGALALAALGLAAGWSWLVALALAWTLGRGEEPGLPWWRAFAFGWLAVPWIAVDALAVGWAFRWTGAWAASGFFELVGLEVTRSGTAMQIEDQSLAVDVACAGLDTLQATLVAGLWMAGALRTSGAWWRTLALLPGLAWLANTARIIMLGAVAVTAGHEAAMGRFHEWGGLSVVVMVFLCAGAWVAWLRQRERSAAEEEAA